MTYKEVTFTPGDTIEEAVNRLLRFKEDGVLASGRFNGVTLYSDNVTMDGAYRAITGMKKEELDSQLNNKKTKRSDEQ